MAIDVQADYDRAGFGGRLSFGQKPAFLQVDFCWAYLDQDSPLYAGVEKARDSAARLLTAARQARVPVVHTEVRFMQGGLDGGVFFRKVPALRHYQPNSRLALPLPELKPIDGEIVVTKQYSSAFFATSLASTLTAMGIDTVVIVGVSTSACVRQTAVDALQHGFIPFVCRDAVGDRSPAAHEANLFDLQAKFAEVVDEQTVLGHFRAFAERTAAAAAAQ